MKSLKVLIILLIITLTASAQTLPQMRREDKVRIKEAMIISKQFGDKIWKGINEVPFTIILVTDSVEFLINHPYPSDDFKLLSEDTLLITKIYFRKAQFSKHLLATFPAVNGVNCIVVGIPENTEKNSTDWIITLLHEHFHQYEYNSPGYYHAVEQLDLSGGDQTGMWMLNYPFPYDSSVVIDQFNKYTSALSTALSAINTNEFQNSFNNYKIERNKFKHLLKPVDYRYFSFQVWQEGIARYTEYKFLEMMDNYQPSAEVKQLADFIPFNIYKDTFYHSQLSKLTELKLKEDKRVCFYAIGFAEGLLLDHLEPDWRSKFLTERFNIENYSDGFK